MPPQKKGENKKAERGPSVTAPPPRGGVHGSMSILASPGLRWRERRHAVLLVVLNYRGKIYTTQNLPFEPFLSAQFSGIKHIHIAVQTSSSAFPRTFSSSPTETLPHSAPTPRPLPRPPAVCILSLSSTALGTSQERGHAAFALLSLAFCTQHCVMQVHPCCSRCQSLFPFRGRERDTPPLRSKTIYCMTLTALYHLDSQDPC